MTQWAQDGPLMSAPWTVAVQRPKGTAALDGSAVASATARSPERCCGENGKAPGGSLYEHGFRGSSRFLGFWVNTRRQQEI